MCMHTQAHISHMYTHTCTYHTQAQTILHASHFEKYCLIAPCTRAYCTLLASPVYASVNPISPRDVSMAEHLRSRSCFVLHHLAGSHFYLWHGSKSTPTMQSVARRALVRLRKRFEEPSEVTVVKEGEEPSVFWTLMEGEGEYMSLAKC